MPKISVDRDSTMDLCQFMESLKGETANSCLFFLKLGDDPLIEEMVLDALSSECECCCDGGYHD